MKLFAPSYYKNFVCIADKCKNSCCKGWEIDIDENTFRKYSSLSGGYAEKIKSSITGKGVPHFKLAPNGSCPHLDGQGLCKIITEYGESYLCDICREHPRFYLNTKNGKEVGLGMSCEEAARIILSSDGYDVFDKIGELDGKADVFDFDATEMRTEIYKILYDRTASYNERFDKISAFCSVTPKDKSDKAWREILRELEYLDESHAELFSHFQSNPQITKSLEIPFERALAYFIFRHCTGAKSKEEFSAALGFALLLERLLASVSTSENVYDMARIISEEIEYSEDNIESLKMEFLF